MYLFSHCYMCSFRKPGLVQQMCRLSSIHRKIGRRRRAHFLDGKIIVLQNFSSKLVFSKTINDVPRLKRISYRQRWKLLILNKSVKNRWRCLRESAQIREQFLGSQRSRRCALYLASFITLRLTSVIRSYTLQFSGYNPSYLPRELTANFYRWRASEQ